MLLLLWTFFSKIFIFKHSRFNVEERGDKRRQRDYVKCVWKCNSSHGKKEKSQRKFLKMKNCANYADEIWWEQARPTRWLGEGDARAFLARETFSRDDGRRVDACELKNKWIVGTKPIDNDFFLFGCNCEIYSRQLVRALRERMKIFINVFSFFDCCFIFWLTFHVLCVIIFPDKIYCRFALALTLSRSW